MKKYIIVMSLLMGMQSINAQTIQRSVIGSAGKVTTSGAYKLSYTVGEAINKKVSSTGLTINQGFQQSKIASTPLPIIGLEFNAVRLNNSEVKLTWKTLSETNNRGFQIERRKEIESNFTPVGFVASNASEGYKSAALNYVKNDDNDFIGGTYYRIKQEDLDGKSTYSKIVYVKGEVSEQVAIQAWPIPATGPVNILINGLSKPDVLLVFDMSGKLVNQQSVKNNEQVQLNSLTPGLYIVRLAENKEVVKKMVVQ